MRDTKPVGARSSPEIRSASGAQLSGSYLTHPKPFNFSAQDRE